MLCFYLHFPLKHFKWSIRTSRYLFLFQKIHRNFRTWNIFANVKLMLTLFTPESLISSFLDPLSLVLSSEGGGVLPRFLFWCHLSGSQVPRLFLKASSKYDGHFCDITAVRNCIKSSFEYISKSCFTSSSSASTLVSMSPFSEMLSSTVNY